MGERAGTAYGDPLTRSERLSLFVRSLLLQSAWNPRGMQNVGFCYTLLPLLRRLHDREERRAFLKRHLALFNTNPALASYVLGAVAAAEVGGADAREVEEVKRGLSGPLGMVGDALFWGALRPFAAVVAVGLTVLGAFWAAAALVLLYGGPYLYFRVRGLRTGIDSGARGAKEVLGPGTRRTVSVVRGLTAFSMGLVLARGVSEGNTLEPWRLVVVALLFLLAYLASKLRIPTTVIAIGCAAGGAVLMLMVTNGG